MFSGFWKDEDWTGAVELNLLENTIDICSLVVHPKYFRQGIAFRLLEFVANYDDPKILSLKPASKIFQPLALYKKFGFQEKRQWMTADGIEKIGFVKSK